MGFPSANFERLFRNPMDQVVRFFDTRHPDAYCLWNLCAERDYDSKHFHGRVNHEYRFYDHNAPEWRMVIPFCVSVDEFLRQNKDNVAAIHCKAGKGRTGTLIAAYLLWCGFKPSAT
jgi:phosphatidylinositol-3,4,5-trisphosphate 3-phosphatase and dual-specificity protein phosphatase PTEN